MPSARKHVRPLPLQKYSKARRRSVSVRLPDVEASHGKPRPGGALRTTDLNPAVFDFRGIWLRSKQHDRLIPKSRNFEG
jgi:hypothetical protein